LDAVIEDRLAEARRGVATIVSAEVQEVAPLLHRVGQWDVLDS
jgi:hypothetical protein